MLDNIPRGPGLDVLCQPRAEVEVEPAKVHLLEVLAVVHVKEDVEVYGPADADHGGALPGERDPGQPVADEAGPGQSEHPVHVHQGDHNQHVGQHHGAGTTKL